MQNSLLLDIQAVLVTFALITPRALVCLTIVPGFGTNTLKGIMRTSVALAVALPAALPTYLFIKEAPPGALTLAFLIMKEAMIGLMLGVVMAIPIWVAQSIGSILDTQRSPIQIQPNSASIDKDASGVGAVLLQAVVLLMIQAGLYVALMKIIIESYGTWPAFNLMPPYEPGQLEVVIKQFSNMFWYIVVYGGPVLIPLLLIDFAFAMIGVFASNLQVSFASSPIKSLAGLFILLVYWPTFSHYVTGDFSRMLDFTASMLDAVPRR